MATYYVAKTGNDSNGGTDITAPKLTIANAIAATSNGDTVEIIDQGSYNEGNIEIYNSTITITHTASALGRPKIYGTGLGGNSDNRAFYVYGEFITYNGLEISNYTDQVIKKGDADYNKFHMSGCFIHDVPKFGSHAIAGDATTKSTIKDTIIYLENGSSDAMAATSNLTLNNCLITSSNNTVSNDAWIAMGALTVTASFCTIIDRGAGANGPIIEIGKIVNCIVSGNSVDGIASDDHTYNLVQVGGNEWRNMADDSNGSAGTGDKTGGPVFIDGLVVGSGVGVVENYNLQSSSPAYNAGVAYGSITTDITGTTRPQGSAPDMGCWELLVAAGLPSDVKYVAGVLAADARIVESVAVGSVKKIITVG